MKKTFSILVMMVFTSIMIFGSSINVKNPNSSTVLLKGQTLRIKWVTQGRQNDFVKIRLFNSSRKKIINITNRTKNKGLFNWKFNTNVPAGQYFIRVKTVDDKVTGDSQSFRSGKNSSPPPKSTTNKSGYFKDNPFQQKTYQLNNKNLQLKETVLKSNIVKHEEPPKASEPIILIFKADPGQIKNGQKYFLRYHYKNATEYAKLYTFENRKKGKFIKSLPTGTNISGKLEMGPVSWNDYTYCLEIANFKSMYYSTARVKVILDLQILRFDSVYDKYIVGRPVRLTYSFVGASKAYIKNITTGKIVKVIDTKGGTILNEAFVFPFEKPSKYRLFIKKYRLNSYLESDIVEIKEMK